MKAFTLGAIGLHTLGEYPVKNADDLVAALNEATPKGTTWERQRLEYHKNRGGMQLDDGGVALDDLGDEQAALTRAMGGVKAKGGSMFAAAQQMNNPRASCSPAPPSAPSLRALPPPTSRSSKSRRRIRSCGALRKARRPAGARRAAAAAAAAAAEGAYRGRLSLQS